MLLSTSVFAGDGWRTLQDGFEYRRSPGRPIHFFRIDPKKYRLDLLQGPDFQTTALTAEIFRQKSRALLVVNGGFFDEGLRSLGLFHRRGQTLNPVRPVSWGIFQLLGPQADEPRIIQRRVWNPQGVTLALQVGPRLVINGVIPSFKESEPSRRSAVGITREKWIEITVSESPVTLRQWAETLQQDCPDALNLDGGGSTQLSVQLPEFSLRVEGLTSVPNALAVYFH